MLDHKTLLADMPPGEILETLADWHSELGDAVDVPLLFALEHDLLVPAQEMVFMYTLRWSLDDFEWFIEHCTAQLESNIETKLRLCYHLVMNYPEKVDELAVHFAQQFDDLAPLMDAHEASESVWHCYLGLVPEPYRTAKIRLEARKKRSVA